MGIIESVSKNSNSAYRGLQNIRSGLPFILDILDSYIADNPSTLEEESALEAVRAFLATYESMTTPSSGVSWRIGKPYVDDPALCLALFSSELSSQESFETAVFYNAYVPEWLKIMFRRSGREASFLEGAPHEIFELTDG